MTNKSFNQQLADAIKLGIAKSQTIIAKNNAKEQNGLAKLSKTLGGQVPADQSGVGTDLGNGTAQEAVPMQMGEKKQTKQTNKPARGNEAGAQPVPKLGKGVLPEDGSNMAMSEMDGNDEASCPMCNGPLHILGSLGNTIHMVCRNCGAMHATTPHDENTEAKEGADPTVAKAMLGEGHKHLTPEQREKQIANRAASVEESDREYIKQKQDKAKKVTKSEPLATMRTTKAKGISGLPAPKSKMVVKAELKKEETNPIKEAPMTALVMPEKVTGARVDDGKNLPKAINHDGSGEVTKGKSFNKGALVEHVKNAANKAGVPVKDVLGYKPPKTLQAVKPAPSPNFNKGSLPMVPGQGVANKNKYLAFMSSLKYNPKTAQINNTRARTINTLNSPEPKPLHPSDRLGKSNIPMTGFAREAAIKTGKPTIPGRPLVAKLTGGVQGQIAAQKKPLIPMVNSGVVAKSAFPMVSIPFRKPKPRGESMFRDGMTVNHSNPSSKGQNFMNFSTYGRSDKDMAASKKKNTRAEHEASKVEKGELKGLPGFTSTETVLGEEGKGVAPVKRNVAPISKENLQRHVDRVKKVTKAEPTMAKPITKSPSSGPAGKAPAIKASPAVMKTPKL